jgi:hypothetical protein
MSDSLPSINDCLAKLNAGEWVQIHSTERGNLCANEFVSMAHNSRDTLIQHFDPFHGITKVRLKTEEEAMPPEEQIRRRQQEQQREARRSELEWSRLELARARREVAEEIERGRIAEKKRADARARKAAKEEAERARAALAEQRPRSVVAKWNRSEMSYHFYPPDFSLRDKEVDAAERLLGIEYGVAMIFEDAAHMRGRPIQFTMSDEIRYEG